MLRLDNLDDQSYDEILEEYYYYIRNIYPDWTDFYDSDPGVTMIQLFAWLKEMQQYYINRIKSDVKHKYLKLMETELANAKPSRGAVVVKNDSFGFKLPSGTKFLAGDVTFETEREFYVCDNEVEDVYNPPISILRLVGPCEYYIRFKKAFRKNDRYVNMHIEVKNDYPVKRNPVEDTEAFVMLNDVKWSIYRDGEFENIDVVDGTLGFIRSGEIKFMIKAGLKPHPDYGYCLKAEFINEEYDVVPCVESACLNYFPVVREDTSENPESSEIDRSSYAAPAEPGNINTNKINRIKDLELILRENLNSDEINFNDIESFSCNVSNPRPTEGGQAAETFDKAFARVRRDLRVVSKAVTPADFEEIVKGTPGLMIEHVKAVCVQNTAKIYVKPFRDLNITRLPAAYISNMRSNLEKYRLITTRCEFYPFRKVIIDVRADIRLVEGEPEPNIRLVLEEYFKSKRGELHGVLEYYEIHRKIGELKSVFLIKTLELFCEDRSAERLNYGDIRLPADALPHLGGLTVKLL